MAFDEFKNEYVLSFAGLLILGAIGAFFAGFTLLLIPCLAVIAFALLGLFMISPGAWIAWFVRSKD